MTLAITVLGLLLGWVLVVDYLVPYLDNRNRRVKRYSVHKTGVKRRVRK